MIQVRLHGHIGTKFRGNLPDGNWLLAVRTPQEAVKAIEANRPGIFQYLVNSAHHGVEYRVLLDGKSFACLEELYLAREADYETIDIIPEVIGASSAGLWEVIAGVVLIVVGIVLVAAFGAGTVIIASGFYTLTVGAVAGALAGLGLSLVIGGIEALIFKPAEASAAKNKPSYLFSGQVNTQGQGGPIPVLYGEMIVGSQMISTYLTTIEVDPKTGEPVSTANDENPVDPTVAGDDVWNNLGNRTIDGGTNDPGFDPSATTDNLPTGSGGGRPLFGGPVQAE